MSHMFIYIYIMRVSQTRRSSFPLCVDIYPTHPTVLASEKHKKCNQPPDWMRLFENEAADWLVLALPTEYVL